MTATLFTAGKFRAFDPEGAPLVGGLLYAYEAGTLIAQNTYTTQAGNVANANPVVLDSTGSADVWITGNYKFILTDALGNQQWSEDNISDTLFNSAFTATSTTSQTIGNGAQVFVTQSGKSFAVGQYLLFTPTSNLAFYEVGFVTSYTGTNLGVTITSTNGSGTFSSWNIAIGAPVLSTPGSINTAQTSIASNTTTDLGTITTQNALVTGTTTITSFGSTASTASPLYYLEFNGALTLTYNATSLITPTAANIITAAGDVALAEYLGTGDWKIRSYDRASGKALSTTQTTFQYLTTSSTYTTPANCKAILVQEVGGGGGGGAVATNAGATGGTTSFNSITAIGGSGGGISGTNGGAGGTGGTGTAYRQAGQRGFAGGNTTLGAGGGGSSLMGFGAGSSTQTTTGLSANANTGGGGGGGNSSNNSGSGGGGGEYAEFYISGPAATYSYSIGAGAAGGVAGTQAGGVGGSGVIKVTEYY